MSEDEKEVVRRAARRMTAAAEAFKGAMETLQVASGELAASFEEFAAAIPKELRDELGIDESDAGPLPS